MPPAASRVLPLEVPLSTEPRRLMLCRIGAATCALELAHVIEVLRPLPLRPVAGMPAFVLGASIIRGVAVPIVDARLLLGVPVEAPPSRLVSLRVDGRSVALAVDDVIGFRAPPPDQVLPPLLRDARSDVISTLGRLDADLLFVLSAARLVPELVPQGTP